MYVFFKNATTELSYYGANVVTMWNANHEIYTTFAAALKTISEPETSWIFLAVSNTWDSNEKKEKDKKRREL